MLLLPVTRKLLPLLLGLSPAFAGAHELPDNRATLVLRDKTHVAITLFLAYPDALHKALAPEMSLNQFVLTYAAMQPSVFKGALLKAQAHFQNQLKLATSDGKVAVLERWVWPAVGPAQEALRQKAVQFVVAPNEHAHEAQLEVRAEFKASQSVTSLRIAFPSAFGRILVVSYKPNEVWSEPNQPPAVVHFGQVAAFTSAQKSASQAEPSSSSDPFAR